MRDFIGNEFVEGGWVAATASGNKTGEYGSILYKILYIKDNNLRVRRLTVKYADRVATLAYRDSTVVCLDKYIAVTPAPAIVEVFDAVVGGVATAQQLRFAAGWLHGTDMRLAEYHESRVIS